MPYFGTSPSGSAAAAETLAATATVGDGTAEDTNIIFDGNALDFRIGIDDGDDTLEIGKGSAHGTTAHMIFDTNGIIRMPLQPAFHVYNSSTDANVTGDGTAFTVDFNTERFDLNGDFASDTFTAPVTGKYLLQACVGFQQTEDSTNTRYRILFNMSNTPVIVHEQRVMRQNDGGQNIVLLTGSVVADMDASDTCSIQAAVYGGSAVVDCWGNSQPETYFSGCLLA